MDFPHVDLPVDIIAWTDVTEDILNIYKQSCRLKACIFALCLEGSITVSINLMDTEIKQGDFVALLPGTIIQFYSQNEKVRIGFVGFSEQCIAKVNVVQSTLHSFSSILRSPVLHIEPTLASYFQDYFALLGRVTTGPYTLDTEMNRHILQGMLYGIDKLYSESPHMEIHPQNISKGWKRKI